MGTALSVKDELLRNAYVGRKITIVLHSISLSGKVVGITEEIIKLDTGNAVSPIKLDAIETYFFMDNSAGLNGGNSDRIGSLFYGEISAFRAELENSKKPNPISYAVFREKVQTKGKVSDGLRQILNIVDYAYKVREASANSDRIKKAYAMAEQLSRKNTNDRNALYLKGILQVVLGKYNEAAESFALVGDYRSALAAAVNERKAAEYAFKALENHLYERYAVKLLLKGEPRAVLLFKNRLSAACNLTQDIDREIFLASIVVWQAYHGEDFAFEWRDHSSLATDQNLEYVKTLYGLEASKRDAAHAAVVQETVKAVPLKKKTVPETVYCGKISSYMDGKRCGFISEHNVPANLNPGTVFFYIGQVNDDELRKQLVNACWKGAKVTFSLGLNPRYQKPAADNIRLAADNAVVFDREPVKQGNIVEYNQFEEYGRILCGNKEIPFRIGGVADPLLRVYLSTNAGTDCKVRFEMAYRDNGKKYALRIVSEDVFPEDLIADWIRGGSLSESELREWRERPYQLSSQAVLSHLGNYQPLEPYVPERKDGDSGNGQVESGGEYILRDVQDVLKQVEIAANLYMAKAASDAQLDEAIQIFTRVLRSDEDVLFQNKRLDTVVFGLTNIYLRKGDYQKAIELLERYRNDDRISREKILNVLIQLYDREKNSPDTLIGLYKEAIQLSQKQNSRMHYILRLASVQQKKQYYSDASDSYELWMQSRKNMGELGKNPVLENSVRQNMAICCYMSQKTDEAKKQAELLLKYNPDNEIAKKILKDEPLSLMEELSASLPVGERSEWAESVENRQNMVSDDLEEFISRKMEQIDLGAVIKGDVKDGVYIGTLRNAKNSIDRWLGTWRQTAASRYVNQMNAAKLIIQICDSGDYEDPELERYQIVRSNAYIYVGRAIASLGDSLAEDLDAPVDSVFYMYQMALRLLRDPESKLGAEQDWVNSFLRCQYLFFLTRYDFKNYVKDQSVRRERDRLSVVDMENREPQYSIAELAVGMMWLVKAVRQSSWAEKLERALYESELCERLTEFFGEENIKISSKRQRISLAQFKQLFDQAIARMDSDTETLEEGLNNCIMNIFTNLRYEEALRHLQSLESLSFINRTDRERLRTITGILRLMVSFDSLTDFGRKADALTDALTRLKRLCRVIEEYPSYLSYHVYLQRLYRLHDAVADKKKELFEQYKPKLVLELTDSNVYIDEMGRIKIQCQVANAQGYQTADNIKIVVTESENLYLLDAETPEISIKGVRGGSSQDAILTVGLKNKVFVGMACDVELQVLYEYNNENVETVNAALPPQTFTLNLYNKNEFVRISNPYRGKTESVMENDDMFYGREEFIQRLVDSIQGTNGAFNRGHAIALYGQTRAGKSSILYHCKDAIKKRYGDKVILADCKSLGETTGAENAIYYTIARSIYGSMRRSHEKIRSHPEFPELKTLMDRMLLDTQHASGYMIGFLHQVSDILYETDPDKLIVIMIDEFTYLHTWIQQGLVSKDFMKFWKAIMQDFGFFAIVVGQDNMPIFKNEYQNEFASMELEQVTYLDRESAIRLMDEPILYNGTSRYRPEALDRLYELTAGSAYLILKLCDALVMYLNETTSAYVTRALVNEFLRKRVLPQRGQKGCVDQVTFEAQIQDRAIPGIDKENIGLLLKIARMSGPDGLAEISKVLEGDGEGRLRNLFDRLVERNVIEKRENRECRIVVSLLKEWLLYTYGQEG